MRCGECADRAVAEELLRVAASAQREPGFQNGAVLVNMLLHFFALMVRMGLILQDRGSDLRGIDQTVKIGRFIEIGKSDRAQFSRGDGPLHRLVGLYVVRRLAVVEDHQVDIVQPQSVQGSLHGRVSVPEIGGPHLGRDEDLFTGHEALVDRPADRPADTRFVSVYSGCIDQTVAVPQRPIDRVFRLLVRERETADPENGHLISAVEHHGAFLQIKFRGLCPADRSGRHAYQCQ